MLNVLDEKWKDHLYDLDQLRNAIHYRSWGQKDPLVEYKQEAYTMFVDLMNDIQRRSPSGSSRSRSARSRRGGRRPAPPLPSRPRPRTESDPAAPQRPDDLFMGPPPRVPLPPRFRGPAPAVNSSLGPVGRATAAVPEVGRNDPCPCGSGKK